jgi:hypothetical protein
MIRELLDAGRGEAQQPPASGGVGMITYQG